MLGPLEPGSAAMESSPKPPSTGVKPSDLAGGSIIDFSVSNTPSQLSSGSEETSDMHGPHTQPSFDVHVKAFEFASEHSYEENDKVGTLLREALSNQAAGEAQILCPCEATCPGRESLVSRESLGTALCFLNTNSHPFFLSFYSRVSCSVQRVYAPVVLENGKVPSSRVNSREPVVVVAARPYRSPTSRSSAAQKRKWREARNGNSTYPLFRYTSKFLELYHTRKWYA
mmetsp:Transcript_18272/g.36954  ORF Transcript_18272/g.36954 Transcript_18272/m.36954 type:complete len:228 (+) Transcript_18272:1633-2316(+)